MLLFKVSPAVRNTDSDLILDKAGIQHAGKAIKGFLFSFIITARGGLTLPCCKEDDDQRIKSEAIDNICG